MLLEAILVGNHSCFPTMRLVFGVGERGGRSPHRPGSPLGTPTTLQRLQGPQPGLSFSQLLGAWL